MEKVSKDIIPQMIKKHSHTYELYKKKKDAPRHPLAYSKLFPIFHSSNLINIISKLSPAFKAQNNF